MALGGGSFYSQNKNIPGAYINFVSAAQADAGISERGVVAMVLPLKWNVSNIVRVTRRDLDENSRLLFGCKPDAKELLPIREALCEAQEVLVYVVGAAVYMSCDFAQTRYGGDYGMKIKVKVCENTGASTTNKLIDVETYYDGELVDRQEGVGGVNDIPLQDNDFVEFFSGANKAAPGTYEFTGPDNLPILTMYYQKALDALEQEAFHVFVSDIEDPEIKEMYLNYTKRMRDECGVKFQSVLYDCAADYEGVVNCSDKKTMYWAAGAMAGCKVNESLTNKKYTGAYKVDVTATQSELSDMVEAGKFAFHRVGGEVRVLSDCNSKVSDRLLASNQIIRIMDQVGNDIGVLFREKYLGKIQNNAAGRMSFWSDVVRMHQELETLGAIEGFLTEDIKVEAGADKSSIVVTDSITPVGSMTKLYMTVAVI